MSGLSKTPEPAPAASLPCKGTVQRALSTSLATLAIGAACAGIAAAQQRREREPNSVYAARRATLAAQVDAPIVLWGFTGREESSMGYVFAQEESFYYLTGHNEEGAGLILLPQGEDDARPRASAIPNETLFLPLKNLTKEKWNGPRMCPSDPDIQPRTGFSSVQPFPEMRAMLERLAKLYPAFYTILPYDKENGGYPHEKAVVDWIHTVVPQAKIDDIRAKISALRQIKSQAEIGFLAQAIDLSRDAQLAALRMMRPGLYEYQVAAKMVEVHAMGGSEAEGYAPIVGAGPNSTFLHYDKLSRKIQDGDIVVLDVGAQFAGYSADITRTIPANGKFTPRQRQIYEIVLGAQNAALAAAKPGMDYCQKGSKSLFKIAYDYINSHGQDLHGQPLGRYFIHGLGHHIGLNVHDPGDYCKPLLPGMVVTVEPGIYIPEENLGVRIEDDILITDSGYKLLSERLPRSPDEIEKIMTEPAPHAAAATSNAAPPDTAPRDIPQRNPAADKNEITALIGKYVQSIDDLDLGLAAQVWWDSPQVSFIHPLGHDRGFTEIKQDIYEKIMGGLFSTRHLQPHAISIHLYGDSAVVEFYWDFTAKLKSDGSEVNTHGRESQIYEREQGAWRLVHVHYSGSVPGQTF